MKILTKEEEAEHYSATVRGGIGGGLAGCAVGFAGVYLAGKRYSAFRSLTLPFRAFLIASTGTFVSIVSADKYSRSFEARRHPEKNYTDHQSILQQEIEAQKPALQRIKDWGTENRYSIVFGSWVASMGTAFAIVGRNPYISGPQKLVQARVYAQGLTLAVVIASLALEAKDKGQGEGRWETVKVLDPKDPTHKHIIEKKIHHERYAGEDQWMDMVAAEEERIKDRQNDIKARKETVKAQHETEKKSDESSKSRD